MAGEAGMLIGYKKKSQMNRNWTGVVASKSSSSDGCGKVDLRQDSSRDPWIQNQPFPVCSSLHLDYAIPLSHSLAVNAQLRGLLSKSDSSHWPEQFLNQKFPPIKLLF